MRVSVSDVSASGFAGLESTAVRCNDAVTTVPEGTVTVLLATIGTCIPHRGSGPCVPTATVPSGYVTVVVPPCVTWVTVRAPDGSVLICRNVPPPSQLVSYLSTRPSLLVAVTR